MNENDARHVADYVLDLLEVVRARAERDRVVAQVLDRARARLYRGATTVTLTHGLKIRVVPPALLTLNGFRDDVLGEDYPDTPEAHTEE